ncbi:MAG: FAD-dependent oxidoreductase [Oscillospiraceae bacterium]|nr:FAD-dependent oxidoreductase [Oscillospiraceae bacterium]
MRVVIIGAGWSGCAAAIEAKKFADEVILLERTDLVLGCGNVGGIMRNNGRYTAAEELIAMGGGELIKTCDENATHKNLNFPGHEGATLYNVCTIEGSVRRFLLKSGIDLRLISRVLDVVTKNKKIKKVLLSNGDEIEGDVFIETTGSTGPMGNCLKYGNGCAMCVLRCPTFGGRVSIAEKAGGRDFSGERENGNIGAFSGSCKLDKGTINKSIVEDVERDGVKIIKLSKEDINMDKLKNKVCQQYALKEFAENLVLLDTGHIKLMTYYYPLEKLRKIEGFENVKFIDPYSGGMGNSVRFVSVTKRDDYMNAIGVDNLFLGGEKSGLIVGHTEAMVSGTLAGYNAVRYALGKELFKIPNNSLLGDFISYSNNIDNFKDSRVKRYTFSGAEYFARMKELGFYSRNNDEISLRIEKLGLKDIFNKI